MLRSLTLILPVAAGLLTGCGRGHEPAPASAPARPPTSMPALAPPDGVTPPGAVASAKPASPAPPPAIDLATAQRPLDKDGNPISDLEMLNDAILAYAGRTMGASVVVQGNFKSPDEEAAARSKAFESQNRTVKSLSDLVTAGLIKALPQPPPGKAYVFDPATQKAALVDKK